MGQFAAGIAHELKNPLDVTLDRDPGKDIAPPEMTPQTSPACCSTSSAHAPRHRRVATRKCGDAVEIRLHDHGTGMNR
ncbi:MAG TPA: hypothetical protein VN329_11960, partial [Roseomonas sp.]|nr:hypothetical protein [Roseomonas sp.]